VRISGGANVDGRDWQLDPMGVPCDKSRHVKAVEFYICLLLAIVTVLLSVLVFTTSRSVEKLQIALNAQQARLNAQQEEINKGSVSQQVGVNLLRESAQVALTNPRMRELLQKNGITVSVDPAATAPTKPAPSPAPAKK
jgi:hypothetical protein